MSDPLFRPKRQVLSIIGLSVLALMLLATLFLTRYLVLASLIGVGLGVLLAPIMNLMQVRFRIPRGLSAVAMVILILGGTAALVYGIIALISDQAALLISRAPALYSSIQTQVDQWLGRFPLIEQQAQKLNLSGTMRTTLEALFKGVRTSIEVVAGFAIILTMALYTAIHARAYFQGVLSLFPAYLRSRAGEVLRCSAVVLRQWFKSQLVVMGISAVVTTVGLWILGIDYWLLFGVMTALLGFIPYVGILLTVFAAALVTLGTQPDKIWWVLGLYAVVQQLEGDVTLPLVMKGGVQLPEVHLIFLMLVMGSLFGILGVFLAPPFLAVGRSIFLMTYVETMDHRMYPDQKIEAVSQKQKKPWKKSA